MNSFYLKIVASTAATVTAGGILWKCMDGKTTPTATKTDTASAATASAATAALTETVVFPSHSHAEHKGQSTFSTLAENGLTNGLCCVGNGIQTGLETGLDNHGKGIAAHGKHTSDGMFASACVVTVGMVASAIIFKKM